MSKRRQLHKHASPLLLLSVAVCLLSAVAIGHLAVISGDQGASPLGALTELTLNARASASVKNNRGTPAVATTDQFQASTASSKPVDLNDAGKYAVVSGQASTPSRTR